MPPAKGNPEVSVEPVIALPTTALPLWSCAWLRVGAGLPEPENGPEGEDGEAEAEEAAPAERPVGRAVCMRYVVATVTTETRAMVDPRVFCEKLAEFDEVKILEKMAVCNWVRASLTRRLIRNQTGLLDTRKITVGDIVFPIQTRPKMRWFREREAVILAVGCYIPYSLLRCYRCAEICGTGRGVASNDRRSCSSPMTVSLD